MPKKSIYAVKFVIIKKPAELSRRVKMKPPHICIESISTCHWLKILILLFNRWQIAPISRTAETDSRE